MCDIIEKYFRQNILFGQNFSQISSYFKALGKKIPIIYSPLLNNKYWISQFNYLVREAKRKLYDMYCIFNLQRQGEGIGYIFTFSYNHSTFQRYTVGEVPMSKVATNTNLKLPRLLKNLLRQAGGGRWKILRVSGNFKLVFNTNSGNFWTSGPLLLFQNSDIVHFTCCSNY